MSSSSSFYIDASSGIIRQKSSLDRETTSSYTLTVTAHDNDPITADRKSGNVSITLTITDVNDNNPLFSPKHYKVNIYGLKLIPPLLYFICVQLRAICFKVDTF